MLMRFRFENFESYYKEAVLELVASGKYKTHSDHEVDLGAVTVLKHGVIYGPNASGKSRLVEAFTFFKYCLEHGAQPMSTAQMLCRNRKENKSRPSSFEMQFSLGESFYSYGFSLIISEGRIVEEWLCSLGKTGSRKPIFTRDEKGVVDYSPIKQLAAEDATRLDVYRKDFEGSSSRLFLTEMSSKKRYSPSSRLMELSLVFQYLTQNIITVSPNTSVTNFQRYYDEATLEKVNKLIQAFDTGISRLIVEETTMDEIKRWLPSKVFDAFLKDLTTQISQADGKIVCFSMRIGRDFFNVSGSSMASLKVTTLRALHNKSSSSFMLEEESDGTQRLFELLDMLLTEKKDAAFIIDELGRSLHTKLTWRFIEKFMNLNKECNRQLIFTTHESYIMDQKLFRLDEIWFVDKDESESSFIYSY